MHGRKAVGEIARGLELRQPQVSKHLSVLKNAGWVDVQSSAQRRLYGLRPDRFRELSDWLDGYRAVWDERFSQIDRLLIERQHRSVKDNS